MVTWLYYKYIFFIRAVNKDTQHRNQLFSLAEYTAAPMSFNVPS